MERRGCSLFWRCHFFSLDSHLLSREEGNLLKQSQELKRGHPHPGGLNPQLSHLTDRLIRRGQRVRNLVIIVILTCLMLTLMSCLQITEYRSVSGQV